jgi:8-oxo-dGTP diphosphatase
MKRSADKKYSPGMWAGVGGHMEPNEVGKPKTACLREIEEETGITEKQIASLKLRYFALLQSGEELHEVYYFIGELTEKPALIQTDEGGLFWVKIHDGKTLPMSEHTKRIYSHWVDNPESKTLKCFFESGIESI